MATNNADEFTSRMFEAINGMLLDVLAAVARKDYDDRRACAPARFLPSAFILAMP